jgi:AcrR family transcriptional regulator
MGIRAKLSAEERRAAIIQAVRRVFAERGFHGTTTRALADAAGVSEALLFKHFPNKEALYSAMQLTCCQARDSDKFERLHALQPSASTLVLMVHFFVSRMLDGSDNEDLVIQNRMMLRSFAEDGEFARLTLRRVAEHWVPKVNECLQVALEADDALPGPVKATSAAWFTHHLSAIIMTHMLPDEPVVDYGMPREQLVEQAVWFILRGMGLKEQSIQRHYNPAALALLTG